MREKLGAGEGGWAAFAAGAIAGEAAEGLGLGEADEEGEEQRKGASARGGGPVGEVRDGGGGWGERAVLGEDGEAGGGGAGRVVVHRAVVQAGAAAAGGERGLTGLAAGGGGEGQAEDGQEDEAEEFPHASGMSVSGGGWCVCKVSG